MAPRPVISAFARSRASPPCSSRDRTTPIRMDYDPRVSEWRALANRWRATVIGVLVLALAFRVADALYERTAAQGVDPHDYLHYAQSIAAGHGFPSTPFAAGGGPSAALPPLYPYFLGALDAITGHGPTVARLLQALLGTLAVAMLAVLVRLIAGRAAGLAALVLGAFYPPLIITSSVTLSEALFIPLEIAALLTTVWSARSAQRRRWWLLLAGVLVGLAILARPVGALLLIPIALVLWPTAGKGAPALGRLAQIAVVGAVAALVVTPWLVRDAVKFHHFVPVTIESGYILAAIMNDHSRLASPDPGTFYPPNHTKRYGAVFHDRRLGEYATNATLQRRALSYLDAHPGYALKVVLYNIVRQLHFGGARYEAAQAFDLGVHEPTFELARIGFWVLTLLAGLGLLSGTARGVPGWVWTGALLLFASSIVTASAIRYRFPADVLLIVAAAVTVGRLAERLLTARASRSSHAHGTSLLLKSS